MPIDTNELRRLSPRDRIKRLKQMEEERKKDADEIERLIKDSMRELKTEKIAEEVTPEQITVDISRLFEAEGERLERTARQGASAALKGAKEYLTVKQAIYDYTSSKRILGYAAAGSLTEEQKASIDKIGERIDRTKYQTASAELANLIVATRAVLHKTRKYAGLE